MLLLKNALRNITRSVGKNVLIGCIAFVIGLSACFALSISQAAKSEKENGLKDMTISATIGVDRQSMMKDISQGEEMDPSERKEQMGSMQEMSLSEMKKYAKADSVKSFTYVGNASFNSDSLVAVSSSKEEKQQGENGIFSKGMVSQGDFTLIGNSSYETMEEFMNGTSEITSGKAYQEGSKAMECMISEELAALNSIKVNDSITLTNPQKEEETYTLKVVGIYVNNETSTSGFAKMAMMEPANQIYLSYDALAKMVDQSKTLNAEEESNVLHMMCTGTYLFENVEKYELFEEQARALGLSEEYTVSSKDLQDYERSLQPLENLSRYAGYFLIVILLVGGCILVVLNIYRVKERKYEIGVLAAIGMKKSKIALQFVLEIFITTMLAIVLATGIGAATSLPLTNALLSTQSTQSEELNGFEGGMSQGGVKNFENAPGQATNTISEVSSAMNLVVLFELIGIGVVLTIVSGGIAVLTILRFEPLKILANRD